MSVLAACMSTAFAARVSDIANTTHNLSASGPGTVKATSESRPCIFCHTPHRAENVTGAPLWNRNLSTNTYTPYSSSSMDAGVIGQPTQGSSKLCLTCHDGTQAIGAVNTYNGAITDYNPATAEIAMTGTGAGGVMPSGAGTGTGNTRNLGINLTNDHPISFTYDASLATADGDLYTPAATTYIKNPSTGVRPLVPLDNSKMECISCHDPHIRETSGEDIKFMRLNRFQTNAAPVDGVFNPTNDIICIACHRKDGYYGSAHAHPGVADEKFSAAGAARFGVPTGLPVWRASCISCHEAHTVQGARRLLREGTDSALNPKSGGNAALEETCYLCHRAPAESVLTSAVGGLPVDVPNIKTDVELVGGYNMPIKSTEQPAGTEVHDIGMGGGNQYGRDYIEAPVNLGKGNLTNRHAECTDCHNAHRVAKTDHFNDDPYVAEAAATHFHPTTNTGGMHDNIASGALRATWGVEPVYGATEFTKLPTSYTVKRGVPAFGAAADVNQPYVTREYQVCLKCHSDYAFNDANDSAGWKNVGRPAVGSYTGGTPLGTNGITVYTNQAMEFQAPTGHEGGDTAAGTGAAAAYATNNHRSWHPIMKPTGRTKEIRTISSTVVGTSFKAPWGGATYVGSQTMYCTDCHGLDTTGYKSHPDTGDNFGPHGSENKFMLKGNYSDATGTGTTEDICFKCHDYTTYATGTYKNDGTRTGFTDAGFGNLHGFHVDKIGYMRCSWCHVAVPHGWKNKALLVNMRDVGPEAGLAAGTEISDATIMATKGYYREPYYLGAYNKIAQFRASGDWPVSACVGAGYGTDGKKWMQDICKNNP